MANFDAIIIGTGQAGPALTPWLTGLVVAGRRPNTDDLGLDRAGAQRDSHGYIIVDDGLCAMHIHPTVAEFIPPLLQGLALLPAEPRNGIRG
jgi:pyruvate/2-oxoglutarate dehydrogenase complex dihydrolipoamide dehydrogenase (E3) component